MIIVHMKYGKKINLNNKRKQFWTGRDFGDGNVPEVQQAHNDYFENGEERRDAMKQY